MFEQTLEAWRRAADTLIKTAESVPYGDRQIPGVCGEWSCQQIVAHLAGWQREALKRYEDFGRGETASITYDVDAFNASSVEALKLFGWYEVMDTFRFTADDLEKAARQLTSADTNKIPMYEAWLVGLRDDLKEHTTQIQEWLERKNSE